MCLVWLELHQLISATRGSVSWFVATQCVVGVVFGNVVCDGVLMRMDWHIAGCVVLKVRCGDHGLIRKVGSLH